MAIEKRFSGKLSDLEIVLVCKTPKCGARIGYQLKTWEAGGIPKCTNCKDAPEDAGELLALKTALRKAIESAQKIPFEVRIEFTA